MESSFMEQICKPNYNCCTSFQGINIHFARHIKSGLNKKTGNVQELIIKSRIPSSKPKGKEAHTQTDKLSR